MDRTYQSRGEHFQMSFTGTGSCKCQYITLVTNNCLLNLQGRQLYYKYSASFPSCYKHLRLKNMTSKCLPH